METPKNSLVALGSAAVIAVYAAGFMKTRPAAARFAAESEERRPPARKPISAVPVAVTPTPAPAPRSSTPPRKAASNAPQPEPVVSHTQTAADTGKRMALEPLPLPSLPTPSAPPPTTTTPDTAQHADTAQVGYKDGLYFGWGYSRHGDIQAAVEIKDGKIKSAFISECLTQYSCSWISMLPSQVVARQSADVDYVSGATQSTNAFYYAVVQALKKAK
jgi:uncharacterized protein with FMN-binding domain